MARPLVESRPAIPVYCFAGRRLGAILPIRLKAECLLCHGPQDQISPDIQNALKTHYPEDQARAFKRGIFAVGSG